MIPYRKTFEVVGFTFHASAHCLECGEQLPDIDPEGNDKHPVFLGDLSDSDPFTCDTCLSSSVDW